MKRYAPFLLVALLPAVVLAFLFPDRAFDGSLDDEQYQSVPGADIVAFVENSCPHCKDFKEYAQANEWEVEYLNITQPKSQRFFKQLQERAPSLGQGVPTIIIDGKVSQGYEDEKTGNRLKGYLDDCRESREGCMSFRDFLEIDDEVNVIGAAGGTCTENCDLDLSKYVLDLWIIGEVDLTLMSLPALSLLLGFLDGFNPCAMWVLITLLTLLINTRDMKKIWVVGGTFLFISGAIYYLFIAAWLNAFLIIGLNAWVQKIIGIVAIGGGGFYLYEALGKDPNVCKVTDFKKKQTTIQKMQKVIEISAWPAMIVGVAILAVSVNMIELVCSAGLPAVFTQILAFNSVSTVARYMYMLIFIIMYMIDDFVIFAIAVFTLHATGLTKKYSRITLIVGGLLMYALGMLMIFAPEALMFG